MKKIMGFLKKPSKQSQQSEQSLSSNYHLVSDKNDESIISLSSVQQEQPQQPSQEEVRKQRLSKLDKQPVQVSERQRGVPRDVTNHPLTIEFGQNAYLVHIFLEDLYLNTFHPSSLNRNPQLKLLQPLNSAHEIRLYTQENMPEDIMTFLQSETYYPSDLHKLTYLHDIYGRIGSKSQEGLISEEKVQSLQKTILKSLMDYLDVSNNQEDLEVITDPKEPLYDALYAKLSATDTNGFFHHFIRSLPEENYDSTITPIFQRIIRNTAENSVKKRHDTLISITLLQDLIHCNTKFADFLFQHELHIPKNPTGQDYQKNTIFGVFLSFTTMDNNSTSLWPHLDLTIKEPTKRAQIELSYRKKIHESIDAFRKFLESLIKLNPKYKRNILDWLYGVIKVNEPMQTLASEPEDKLSSKGWFCNFLVLLLKLCENMLQDPQKYPTWISKIDFNYIYSNPVFEDKSLLDGTKIPPCSPEKYQELQESKFSFGTELIFAAAYAWFLSRESINAFVFLNRKLWTVRSFKQTLNAAGLSFSEEKPAVVSRLFAQTMIQLFDPYLMEQLHRLQNFQILMMLNAYGQKISGLQDLSSSGSALLFERLQAPTSDKRPPIPKFWSLNVNNYLIHFTNVNKDILPTKFSDLNLVMNFILSLILNKFDTSLPDLRTISLRWIVNIPESVEWSRIDEQFGTILKASPFYQKNLPQALISSFLDLKEIYVIQNLPSGSDSGRVDPLAVCNNLLEKVFLGNPDSYLTKYLKGLFQNDQERYLQFMNIFMDDIISLGDDLCAKLAQHGQLLEVFTKKEQQTSFEVIINALRHYYRFAANLSKYCPEFFLDDIVRDQFAVCLNYATKVLNSEGFLVFLQKIETVGETPSPGLFVASIVRAYANLAHSDDFMQSIVNDKENSGIGYFYQTQLSCEENKTLNDNEKQKFSQLVATLDLLTQSSSEFI